METNTMFI